jgi:hypothetical protein
MPICCWHLVSGDARGTQVQQQFLRWLDHSVDLHAPALARYEVANALTRLIVANAFPADKVEAAWANLSVLPITYHASVDARRVMESLCAWGGKMLMTRRILLWQNFWAQNCERSTARFIVMRQGMVFPCNSSAKRSFSELRFPFTALNNSSISRFS